MPREDCIQTPPATPLPAECLGSAEPTQSFALHDAEDAMQLVLHHLQASSLVLDSILHGLATGDISADDLRAALGMLVSETHATRRRTDAAMQQLGASAIRQEPV